MRYVIVLAGAGLFLAWDLVNNRGQYTAELIFRIGKTAAWASFWSRL